MFVIQRELYPTGARMSPNKTEREYKEAEEDIKKIRKVTSQ